MRTLFSIPLLAVVMGLAQAGVGFDDEQPKKPETAPEPALVVQLGHSGSIMALAFSPDGKLVLTGSEDGSARLWDARTGQELGCFVGHEGAVQALAFSSDGKHILTGGGDHTARLWDVRTGEDLRVFQCDKQGTLFGSVAFSSDGKRILTVTYKEAKVWDVGTGKELKTLPRGTRDAAVFSPDGKRMLTRDKNTARLWDAETGQELDTLQQIGKVFAAAFSPDGKQILIANQGKPGRLLDAQTGKEQVVLAAGNQMGGHVGFTADGKRVFATSSGNALRLWDAGTGRELKTVHGSFPRNIMAISPDGKQFLRTGKKVVVSGPMGRDVPEAQLCDTETGKVLVSFEGSGSPVQVRTVAFAADGKQILIGEVSDRVNLWDAQAGKPVRTLKVKGNAAEAISPDGKLILTGGAEGAVRLWDSQTGQEVRKFQGHKGRVISVTFSPDGSRILTGGEDTMARLWDARTGKELVLFEGHTKPVISVAFAPDGKRVVTGCSAESARLWDSQTGQELKTFREVQKGGAPVVFSPDGKRILVRCMLCDIQDTSGPGLAVNQRAVLVSAAAFSPDSERLVTGGLPEPKIGSLRRSAWERNARLWDVRSRKQLSVLEGHLGSVRAVAFSPDGKRFLTAGDDYTIRLWDAKTCKTLCRIVTFADGSWAVVDTVGRYDASNGGDVKGLHWVVNQEPIALDQFKERYYDPGLLAKHLGFSKEPLRDVTAFTDAKPYPDVQVSEPTGDNPKLTINLTNRGGGIGRVVVNLNGKEITADAREHGEKDADAKELKITLNLRGDPRLKPGGKNAVEVQAFNAEGGLRSRGMAVLFEGEGKEDKEPTQLWAIVAGVSQYAGKELKLNYPAKDAEDFANALKIASTRLFGTDKVRLTLLTTSQAEANRQPSHDNLVKALKDARQAKAGDVVVIYLAGHGINDRGQDGDYYYLTCEAKSADLEDAAVRRQCTLSSPELTDLLKMIPAQKQVLILDTCASGKALEKLAARRDVPGSQVRAMERVKDRTGLHVLAGCAADAVSYEATRYGQGVLTYSLLQGMRGAKLREGEYVDVVELFGYAADRVPELARDIGGVQRPVVASPRGSSFDIGQVKKDDQDKIPLQKVRPLVLRATLQEEVRGRDVLGLSEAVNDRLRGASSGRGAVLVYVDASRFSGGIEVGGKYKVNGDKVSVSVTLGEGERDLAAFQVEGGKDKLDDLAGRIVSEIEKRLAAR